MSPVLDLLVLIAFVAIGGQAHDLRSTADWFVVVLWPLVVGWFAAASVFRIYSSGAASWLRVVLTWAVGMAIAVFLRMAVTSRPTPLPFVMVLLVFTGVATVGWRGGARLISAQRAGARMSGEHDVQT